MKIKESLYKKKKISDIIRFVKNSTEYELGNERITTPNYSILLGAGASVTSGIRSGSSLVKEWKNEIYKSYKESEENPLSIEEYFSPENAPDWYDEKSAYSCLFEELYYLQRQRRVFVEKEVAEKTPSIGYAYLVRLIEKGYFNTVFTTNFDDLLNESFYRFSKNRPIVCAHDSSISGITITSKRPKIIKLHGDYLFDNIKATQQETEALEGNMKMKFQEFAKDFGLIVVGYSGGDKSVMDILSQLLDSEDYLKNGIYWCVRKGSNENEFSPHLKSLLHKDRVFLIEIDGFDEFFAELNFFLNSGELPIDDSFLTLHHQESIINQLTGNKHLNKECKYLREDCEKLKSHFEDNQYIELMTSFRKRKSKFKDIKEKRRAKRKSPFKEMTPEQSSEIIDLTNDAYIANKRKDVLERLKNMNLFQLKDSQYKIELLELEISILPHMSDDDIDKYYGELIRLNPNNERYYIAAANRMSNIHKKEEFYKKAIEQFPNDHYIINEYCEYLLDYCEEQPDKAKCEGEIATIQRLIDLSLEKDGMIRNEAYVHKCRWVLLKYANDTKNKTSNLEHLCNEVISISKYHPNTIRILYLSELKTYNEKTIQDALEFYFKGDNPDAVETLYIELIKYYLNDNKITEVFECFENFEKHYSGSDGYKLLKIGILQKYEYYEDALILLDTLPEYSKTVREKISILDRLGKTEEIKTIYENYEDKSRINLEYLASIKDYKGIIEYYRLKREVNGYLSSMDLTSYAYALLQNEKYKEVMTLLKEYYDNPQVVNGIIVINYLYAAYKSNCLDLNSTKRKIKEKVLDKPNISNEDMIKLGAYCVIGDTKNVVNYLSKALKDNPDEKYNIKEWPIIQPYLSDPQIIQLLTPTPQKLQTSYK